MDTETIYQNVQQRYGSVARAVKPEYSGAIAKAFGYSEEEINSVPKDANLGLVCGNPLAIASLRPGETVVDLGSGAGFDVFLAVKRVGANGRAIGVDMNEDMLARARQNLAKSPEMDNVTFVQANITSIPLDDGIADCVISNCVINLVPGADKPTVFVEMARILKSGGRVALSDILARKALPPSLKADVALYTGCIAGAATIEDYKQYLKDAGFSDILIVDTESDLNIYLNTFLESNGDPADCCSRPTEAVNSSTGEKATEKKNASCCSQEETEKEACQAAAVDSKFNGINLNEWVGSFKIFALKP
ncbi:hypothetical protein TWF694_006752 [Orbilia ellipsospora]|uniref:Arsenite methyltransferase n=1 Tax=Orbilia ellipsospora TaxID=2528407 RepID=A0AAV9XMR8_9PEZI